MSRFLRNNYVNSIISIILLVGVGLVVFSPEYLLVKWGANHAVKMLLAYLGAGLLFLFLDQKRLMFICFACTAILAIFLKVVTNSEMKPPEKTADMPTIKVAHFNVNNSNEDFASTIKTILTVEADFISIQETTPYWDSILWNELRVDYPHTFSQPDLGLFGMTVFSKKPFIYIDTVRYEEIPNIVGSIALDEEHSLNFIGSHLLPALNYKYYARLKEHLNFISDYCNKHEKPMLTFGDYHTVPWSNEVFDFKQKTNLSNSRKGFTPTFPHGASTLLEVPIDHFFFSEELKCLSFSTVSSLYTSHLGIQGTFQLKSEHAKE